MTKRDEIRNIVIKAVAGTLDITKAIDAITELSKPDKPTFEDCTSVRNQPHLMEAEGTWNTEPTEKQITDCLNNYGYEVSGVEIGYDTLQTFWRWSCSILKINSPA